MKQYSRRQLEALGEPLGESVTQTRPGGYGRIYGSGGGGPTSSTTYTSNIPEWMRPQVETLLGGAMQEYFNTERVPGKKGTTTITGYDESGQPIYSTTPGSDDTYRITGVKPFVPYSTNMEDYVAQFSPLQQQAQYEASGMQRPGQFGIGSEYAGQAGMGGLESTQQAYGYGGEGYGSGMLGQRLGTEGGGYYGGLGAGYGGAAAAMSPEAQRYGQMGAGTGQRYEQMATDPGSIQAYMSPYMQNVVNQQKESALQDYQEKIMPQIQAQAVKAGAFGGSRDAVQRAMAQRDLGSRLQNIQAAGTQKAYEDAQRAQQFGITSGLQGLQTGLQGLGQAGQLYGLGMQGAQTGLQGVQQQLAGTAQGMQGAGLGLQGVQGAQAGYNLLGQSGVNLANIGTAQQAADVARMDVQNRLGAEQQAREQQMINQAIQNYATAQEYPFEQLSKYSGLIRGYYTPSTTQSTYQANNPAAQMAGLVAQGAGTVGALSRKAGGSIKEKKYAEGGITDIDQKVMNDPTAFSPETINKGIANESISKMAGAIGLSGIEKARNQAQQEQALTKPAPQGTILGDLQQKYAMAQGIETAPTSLRMAGGGIIAFDEGGLSEDEEDIEPIGIADYMKVAKKYLKQPKTQEEIDYEQSLRARPKELEKQREIDRYLALAKFGSELSKAGAKTKSFAGAVGEAGSAALPSLAAAEKAYREGVAGSGKELAALGARGRTEEAELGKAGFDMYGKAKQREAGTSNMKVYTEDYVKKMRESGDKRPESVLRNEAQKEFVMLTAEPRYQAASTQRYAQEQDVLADISRVRDSKSYRELSRMASIPIKPGMDPDLVSRIESAKQEKARLDAELDSRKGQVMRQGAPAKGDQVTVGGRTFSKPPNMTQEQWEAYKKYAAGAR